MSAPKWSRLTAAQRLRVKRQVRQALESPVRTGMTRLAEQIVREAQHAVTAHRVRLDALPFRRTTPQHRTK